MTARACRDGVWRQVPAAELVYGDLVHVRVGDLAPADLLVGSGTVLVDQSSLTGESVPVDRGAGETRHAGATIARGEATGLVTATGARTYFGRTAELVRTAGAADHLGRVVLRMVRVFIAVDLLLAVAATAYLAVTGAAVAEVVSFGVVLLLASVPVARKASRRREGMNRRFRGRSRDRICNRVAAFPCNACELRAGSVPPRRSDPLRAGTRRPLRRRATSGPADTEVHFGARTTQSPSPWRCRNGHRGHSRIEHDLDEGLVFGRVERPESRD
ncbi:P-type ATPase [Amycolatopsis nivea]